MMILFPVAIGIQLATHQSIPFWVFEIFCQISVAHSQERSGGLGDISWPFTALMRVFGIYRKDIIPYIRTFKGNNNFPPETPKPSRDLHSLISPHHPFSCPSLTIRVRAIYSYSVFVPPARNSHVSACPPCITRLTSRVNSPYPIDH